MKNIQIIEIEHLIPYCDGLIELLVDSVGSGASMGFIAPLKLQDAQQYWEEIQQKLQQQRLCLLLALQGQTVIGSVQLSLSLKANAQHRAEVEKLMVLSSFRSQGIGTLLMQQLENVSRRMALRLLVLDTREGDVSEQLYLKMDFQRAGIIPGFALNSDGGYAGTALYYKELMV
ncbi:acetyltransferase (GNAT) family protein [Acinetobacter calcoaceticus]|uniref:Acetyltransferase (GNAT) family protein n=1 Tax=Acinetobacter calcoaceticus TaxID=471 RepID=A0A4R1XR58_ACICA|nr:acetyltransferase (GNAT) family protein [Acinetobacter calcoaceticus]